MTDCANVDVRELLPEHLHDVLDAPTRARVDAHLAVCQGCRRELALLARSRAAMRLVPAVDVDRIVAALPRPLRAASAERSPVVADIRTHRRRRWEHGTAWRAAAAALITVGAVSAIVARGRIDVGPAPGAVATTPSRPEAVPGQAVVPSAPLAVAPASDSAAVLDDRPSAVPHLAVAGGISELSDAALLALLGEVDDVEAVPDAEPPPILTFGTEQSGAL